MKSYLLNLWLIASPLIALVVPRAEGAKADEGKPVLLMLMTDGNLGSLEERFRNELALELETHTLSIQPSFQFSSDNLSGRIDEIRSVAATVEAEAVIWLEKKPDSTVSLQLIATAPGQSTVRSVEAGPDGDFEGELAVAARTLLKELRIAVIDRGKPATGLIETGKVGGAEPTDSSDDSGGESAQRSAKRDARMVHPALALDVSGDMQGNAGPSVMLGGWMGMGFGKTSGVFGEISLAVFGAPSTKAAGGTVHLLGIRPGIGIGYLVGYRKIRLGPYLGLQVPWERATVALDGAAPLVSDWWNLRFQPSLEMRFPVHRSVLLVMRPGLGVQIRQQAFERDADGAEKYASPYLEWHLTAGLGF